MEPRPSEAVNFAFSIILLRVAHRAPKFLDVDRYLRYPSIRSLSFRLPDFMTAFVRIHRKGQMTLPSRLRSAIGIADGDLMEATVHRGRIVLTPKLVVDRSKFPDADG
jgi:AbrB family looped-hinge helix DNA binding protein